jgi:hypothetical protein
LATFWSLFFRRRFELHSNVFFDQLPFEIGQNHFSGRVGAGNFIGQLAPIDLRVVLELLKDHHLLFAWLDKNEEMVLRVIRVKSEV